MDEHEHDQQGLAGVGQEVHRNAEGDSEGAADRVDASAPDPVREAARAEGGSHCHE
jgi:hypothetical protein